MRQTTTCTAWAVGDNVIGAENPEQEAWIQLSSLGCCLAEPAKQTSHSYQTKRPEGSESACPRF